MRRRRPLLALALALVSSPSSARAQPAEAPAPEAPLASPPPPAPPPPAPPAAATGFRYQLYGFLRLKGGVIADDPNVAFVGRNDGFTLQNARLGVAASYGDRLALRLSADGAVDERVGANATEGTLRFALKDAFLDARLVSELTARAGRFEPIFDLEEIVPYTERAFVDRALESRGILSTQGYETAGLSPGRSLGVALRDERVVAAGPAAIGFELAVTNGNGEFEASNDNDTPAISGALFASFAGGRSLIFAAGRWKRRTVGELPFRQTETDVAGAAGILVRVGPLEAAAQGIARHTTFSTTGGPAENSAGAHAQVAFAVQLGAVGRLAPGYRFAIYDPSDLIATDLVQEHTAGITFVVTRLPLRLQLNVTHAVEEAQRELSNDRVEAALEVSL